MKAIVVGCGRVGAQVANRLFHKGHIVTVIDITASAFNNLDPDFRGRTLEGDVLAQDMLRRAGIQNADGLAAVTSSDSLNAVVAHLAQHEFGVRNVVARNYEPRYVSLYEAFGVQAVAPSVWGSQRIEEMLSDVTLRTVFSAGNGEVEVYEAVIPPQWHGTRVGDIVNHSECMPIALTRAGKASIPTADTVMEAGDLLYINATFDGIAALRQRLAEAGKEK
ncbi:MAG: TrkA family potassium uptake protein [Anaerolineae bacterium]|nr:TrkA family potassium uptake protein [Anaerolineae bacterium]